MVRFQLIGSHLVTVIRGVKFHHKRLTLHSMLDFTVLDRCPRLIGLGHKLTGWLVWEQIYKHGEGSQDRPEMPLWRQVAILHLKESQLERTVIDPKFYHKQLALYCQLALTVSGKCHRPIGLGHKLAGWLTWEQIYKHGEGLQDRPEMPG